MKPRRLCQYDGCLLWVHRPITRCGHDVHSGPSVITGSVSTRRSVRVSVLEFAAVRALGCTLPSPAPPQQRSVTESLGDITCVHDGYLDRELTVITDYRDIAPETAQFVYCPKCAARLDDRLDEVDAYVRPTCPSSGWIYYPSNGMGALVVAEAGDSIVVIYPPDAADADAAFPGGIVEYGETPEKCAIRETKEETGLDITDLEELCRFLSYGPFGPMLHFGFRARVAGGVLVEGDEGPSAFTPRDRLATIAADREGSRRVLGAYLHRVH